jgi:tight adherence protein B
VAPKQALAGGIAGAAVVGLLLGGPVAAAIACAYAGLGGRAWLRRVARRRAVATRSAALDALAGLAADLRAGLPPAEARSNEGDRLRRLTGSVWHLAERTGAPAADLVERIEADARATDRARAAAAAQAAGAQATSMLLAALPLAGLGLGVLMGADPFHVLLHTPLGAACGLAAVVLQAAGLLWSERLVGGVTR